MTANTVNDARTIAGNAEGTPLAGNGTTMDISISDGPTMRPNDAAVMRGNAGSALGYIDQYEPIRELGGGGCGCIIHISLRRSCCIRQRK